MYFQLDVYELGFRPINRRYICKRGKATLSVFSKQAEKLQIKVTLLQRWSLLKKREKTGLMQKHAEKLRNREVGNN